MSMIYCDVLVVGAGAAGMMAACTVAKHSCNVIVVDGNDKCGRKLYITGKGRCNITNDATNDEFLKQVVSNYRFLYSAINSFGTADTIEFFNSNGCELVVERGGRVFPKSNKASDITKVLERQLLRNGAKVHLGQRVVRIKHNKGFEVATTDNVYHARTVIMATGGVSYPLTGSDGSGIRLVQDSFGHKIIELRPALVGIEFVQDVSSLEGLSLRNVSLNIMHNSKVIKSLFGEMVFTRRGASGPIILSASSLINRLSLSNLVLSIDLKSALDIGTLDSRILRDFDSQKNKLFKNALDDLLPSKLIPYIVGRSLIGEHTPVNNITKEQRQRLGNLIKGLAFDVARLCDIATGIVTAGGVDTTEINPKTMQSKLVEGLYFAGEMIDVDAYTGGYNIQIALSTGYLAGTSAANYIK